MIQHEVTPEDLAADCAVDPQTVKRWIGNSERVPHPRHRAIVSRSVREDETYLWPPLRERGDDRRQLVSASQELIETFQNRASVPREMWLRFVAEAQANIDVLFFSGTFFAQTNPRIAAMLKERAGAGVDVRLCFGDPSGSAVETRDREERLRGTLAAKIHSSLTYYQDLVGVEKCEVRLHNATLYASLFRFDDSLVVNPHIWGQPASANPLLHLKRLDDYGWFAQYTESFEAIWANARPWLPEEDG